MHEIIDTPKIGPVVVSHLVVTYFKNKSKCDDDCKAAKQVVAILQDTAIEQLEVPASIKSRVALDSASSKQIEFWLHPTSSIIFLLNPYQEAITMLSRLE